VIREPIHAESAEYLFSSVMDAVRFALRHSSLTYQRPSWHRMASSPSQKGALLGGYEGAAQAGMIRAEIAAIGLIGEAILVADVAPRERPCDCKSPCCSGSVANPEWSSALSLISNHLHVDHQLCGHYLNVRVALVKRFFGEDLELSHIAKRCGLNRDTVGTHNAKVVKVLKTLVHQAWIDIDTRLVRTGLIEPEKVA
jgi:hypothetical protein